MKPLEERKAAREKQRDNEAKEREGSPDQKIGGDTSKEENLTAQSESQFAAKDYLNKNVQSISVGLSTLTDEQLRAVESEEKNSKNRTGVNDAIATERKKREAAAQAWGNNR